MHAIATRLQHLLDHGRRLAGRELKTLVAEDPARAVRMALRVDGLYANFARQHVDAEALDALLSVARASGMGEAIHALLHGASVNRSEGRPALHSALRTVFDSPVASKAAADAAATRRRMQDMAHGANRKRACMVQRCNNNGATLQQHPRTGIDHIQSRSEKKRTRHGGRAAVGCCAAPCCAGLCEASCPVPCG